MKKQFLVVINPVPNRARSKVTHRFLAYLKQQQLNYQVYPTEACHSANFHYFSQHLAEFTDLIVIGGDGTFHNVLNSLPQGHGLPIGLIPAGTGNDFARGLYGDQRNNLPFIFEQVVGKWTQDISLGVCTFADGKEVLFHNVLGLGFDALIAKELKHAKGLMKSLGYLAKAAQHIPFYQACAMQLKLGKEQLNYPNMITAFANSEYFGAGMKIAPGADPCAPTLNMCRIEKLSRFKVISQILRLFNGSHVNKSFVDYRTLDTKAEVTNEGLHIEADGEYLGTSPCVIDVRPCAIKIKRL